MQKTRPKHHHPHADTHMQSCIQGLGVSACFSASVADFSQAEGNTASTAMHSAATTTHWLLHNCHNRTTKPHLTAYTVARQIQPNHASPAAVSTTRDTGKTPPCNGM
jgi:hypothetical protein